MLNFSVSDHPGSWNIKPDSLLHQLNKEDDPLRGAAHVIATVTRVIEEKVPIPRIKLAHAPAPKNACSFPLHYGLKC